MPSARGPPHSDDSSFRLPHPRDVHDYVAHLDSDLLYQDVERSIAAAFGLRGATATLYLRLLAEEDLVEPHQRPPDERHSGPNRYSTVSPTATSGTTIGEPLLVFPFGVPRRHPYSVAAHEQRCQVYDYLLNRQTESATADVCVSFREIAADNNLLTINTAVARVRELQALGLLRITGGNGTMPNRYVVIPTDDLAARKPLIAATERRRRRHAAAKDASLNEQAEVAYLTLERLQADGSEGYVEMEQADLKRAADLSYYELRRALRELQSKGRVVIVQKRRPGRPNRYRVLTE